MKYVLSCLLLSLLTGLSEELTTTNTFRVMTYNIHHGQGTDGQIDLKRIAALIKNEKADIVALQEVDRGTVRTGRRDLPTELAKLTGMNFHFAKNIDYQGGEYGNAILSRFPILETTNLLYQKLHPHEQRGLLQAVLDVGGRKLLFLNTHLDYHENDAQRLLNVKQMKQALNAHPKLPVILCGDFNETPGSRVYKGLSEFLTDTWKQVGKGTGFTFSSSGPFKRIDYIWLSKIRPFKTWIPKATASDHLPIVAEFTFE
jgi:endonuclease/exonuclease/phosphatase family metal-dependent hydrolase